MTRYYLCLRTQKILFHFSFSKFDEDNASLLFISDLLLSCFCNIATQIGEKYFYESRLLCNELQIKVILSKWVSIIVCWVQFQPKMFSQLEFEIYLYSANFTDKAENSYCCVYSMNKYVRINKSHFRRQRRESIRWFSKYFANSMQFIA